MANPKRKKGRRKNGLFGSDKAKERARSDERLRKRFEAQQAGNRRRKKRRGNPSVEVKVTRGAQVSESVLLREKNARRRRANAAHVEKTSRELFRKLHWGDPAKASLKQFFVSDDKPPYAVLGEIERISYITHKGTHASPGKRRDGDLVAYDHDFEPGRTFLVVNGKGELLIAKTSKHGGYRVTADGIVG